MIYQVHAVMFFDIPDEARDFFEDCRRALDKATVVNPGQLDQECSQATLILCHHDDHPPEACDLNRHLDNCPPPGP